MIVETIVDDTFIGKSISLSMQEVSALKVKWDCIVSLTKEDKTSYAGIKVHKTALLEFDVFINKIVKDLLSPEDVIKGMFTEPVMSPENNTIKQVLTE